MEEKNKKTPKYYKITRKEVIKIISKQSGLTSDQVRTCLSTYVRLLDSYITMDNVPENIRIEFPFLGYFHMIKKNGRPSGTYYYPKRTGEKDENGKDIYVKVEKILEEDEPTYFDLGFKPYGQVSKEIKRITMERNRNRMRDEYGNEE